MFPDLADAVATRSRVRADRRYRAFADLLLVRRLSPPFPSASSASRSEISAIENFQFFAGSSNELLG